MVSGLGFHILSGSAQDLHLITTAILVANPTEFSKWAPPVNEIIRYKSSKLFIITKFTIDDLMRGDTILGETSAPDAENYRFRH